MLQNLLLTIDDLDIGTYLNTTGVWTNINTTQICVEGFYFENNSNSTSTCTPLCNFWMYALEILLVEDVVLVFEVSMFVAIVSSVILLIEALWLTM